MMNAFSQNDKMVLVGGTDFEPMDLYDSLDYLRLDQIKMKGFLGGNLKLYDYCETKPNYDYYKVEYVDTLIIYDIVPNFVTILDTTYEKRYYYPDSSFIEFDTLPGVVLRDTIFYDTL